NAIPAGGFRGVKDFHAARGERYADWAYGIPVVILALEYYFAGGLDVTFDGTDFADRPPKPAFRPPLRAQAGLVRLLCVLLWGGPESGPEFDRDPARGVCWSYHTFGAAGDLGCMSKSGTVAIGLRALAGGLGLF